MKGRHGLRVWMVLLVFLCCSLWLASGDTVNADTYTIDLTYLSTLTTYTEFAGDIYYDPTGGLK